MANLFTIQQVADMFHVTPRTIQSWLVEEDPAIRLNGIQMGRKWMFEDGDIQDFIDRRRQRTQERLAAQGKAMLTGMDSVEPKKRKARKPAGSVSAERNTEDNIPTVRHEATLV